MNESALTTKCPEIMSIASQVQNKLNSWCCQWSKTTTTWMWTWDLVYLRLLISQYRGNRAEICDALDCKGLLLHLCKEYLELRTYILPVLLYWCKTWIITRPSQSVSIPFIPAWCLPKILQIPIPYTRHSTNVTFRIITGCLTSLWKGQVPPVEVLRTPGSLGSRGRPPPCYHRCRRSCILDAQEAFGWEQWMKMPSRRTLGSTQYGGRQETGIFGTKSVSSSLRVSPWLEHSHFHMLPLFSILGKLPCWV